MGKLKALSKSIFQYFSSRSRLSFFLSALFALSAFWALRIEIALDIGWQKSLNDGLILGLVYDVLCLAIPFSLGLMVQRAHNFFLRVFWVPVFAVLYISSFSSALYYLFFKSSLQWWVVLEHITDATVVGDQALELALTPLILISVSMFLGSVIFGLWSFKKSFWKFPNLRFPVLNGAFDLLLAAFVVLAAIGMQQWPRSHRRQVQVLLGSTNDVVFLRSPVLAHPLIDWLPSISGRVAYVAGEAGAFTSTYLSDAEKKNPASVLRAYREQDPSSITSFLKDPFPLNDDFVIDPDLQQKWLKALGFAENAKPSTLFMFLESFRSYELADPVQAPLLYPRLTKIFKEHGIFLTRGYTSAYTAGQTVRGMWQTFCSVLPNMMGSAPYLNNAGISADCLPEYLGNHGFQTTMFLATAATFHNKRAFEEQHGTQKIFDKYDYDQENQSDWTGWGVPDARYFSRFLDQANELALSGSRFFIHGINTNTHPPFTNVKGALAPDGWKKKTDLKWTPFHASFRRLDNEVADFIEDFLKSPAANNSYLVLAGDHSTPAEIPRSFEADPRATEIRFRVPVIFISKNMPTPMMIEKPFHELDVGLTIAAINGEIGKNIPWSRLGRPLSPDKSFRGSDWTFMTYSRELYYRNRERSCYTLGDRRKLRCYLDNGEDPLFSKNLVEVPEKAEDTLFFNKVIEADFLTVSGNKIAPKKNP